MRKMNEWQVVPRRTKVSGLKFRLRGKGNKLTVYIGAGARETIRGYNGYCYCNIYKKGSDLMIQLTKKSTKESRKVSNWIFSLPFRVVKQYWTAGAKEIEVVSVVEKNNLLLVDLRSLGEGGDPAQIFLRDI